jgi:hypothetical protein
MQYLTNFRVDIQFYQHKWKLGKQETVWKHDAQRAECFRTIFEFSQFPQVLIFITYLLRPRETVCFVEPRPVKLRATTAVEGLQNTLLSRGLSK